MAEETETKRSVTESIRHAARAEDKPRQWIYDRCNGKEAVMSPERKPCCFLLYPNGLLKLLPGKLWMERYPFICLILLLVREVLLCTVLPSIWEVRNK